MPVSERFDLKKQERHEVYRTGAFLCKQEANEIEIKTVSCKLGLNPHTRGFIKYR